LDIARVALDVAVRVPLERLPVLLALGELLVAYMQRELASRDVDGDDVAILYQRDRAAIRRFGADMTDGGAGGKAGEAPVRHQGDVIAFAGVDQVAGDEQHLAHAGATARAFV